MSVHSSTRFRLHIPSCKSDVHGFLAHENKGTETTQNLLHMRMFRDDHVQSTKSLKTSDSRVPSLTRRTSRRNLPERIGISVSQTTPTSGADPFTSRRAHAELMMPGKGGKNRGDASRGILTNRVSSVEIDAPVEQRSRLSSDESVLLNKMRVEAKLGILRELHRNINLGITSRGGGPV